MLTGKQQAIYRPLVDRAWSAFCKRDIMGYVMGRDAWYRKVLVQELGIYSTKEIPGNDGQKFDALCLVFATITGDQKEIEYWSSAAERRALWMLRQTMQNAGVDEPYVRGIARNMGMGDRPIQDLPAELILKINTAVFIYMKRRQKHQRPAATPAVSANSARDNSDSDPALSFP